MGFKVGHTVVDTPAPPFVEAQHNVDTIPLNGTQPLSQLLYRQGTFRDPPFQEVPGKAEFRKDQQVMLG